MIRTAPSHTQPQSALAVVFDRIPQEIIDSTIDHLEGDGDSLKAVALVARAWYPRTRGHIFRELVIGGGNIETRCAQLKELLKTKPWVRQYIRGLTLVDSEGQFATGLPIVDIIPMLLSITSLAVEGKPYFHWDLLSHRTAFVLYQLMVNPRITKVSFTNVKRLDIIPFARYHNLRELIFKNVLIDDHPDYKGFRLPLPLPSFPTPDDHLRTLDITACGHFLNILIPFTDRTGGTLKILQPTTLRVGTMFWDRSMKVALDRILQRGGRHSVETYTIVQEFPAGQPLHDGASSFPLEVFEFDRLPKLKNLDVTFAYNYCHVGNLGPLPNILLQQLDQISQSDSPSQLATIRLIFDFRGGDDAGREILAAKPIKAFAQDDFWSELDTVLVKPAFSRMETLSIVFNVEGYCTLERHAQDEARGDIFSRMKTLASCNGFVDVSFSYSPTRPS